MYYFVRIAMPRRITQTNFGGGAGENRTHNRNLAKVSRLALEHATPLVESTHNILQIMILSHP